jgi:hypothetical protein
MGVDAGEGIEEVVNGGAAAQTVELEQEAVNVAWLTMAAESVTTGRSRRHRRRHLGIVDGGYRMGTSRRTDWNLWHGSLPTPTDTSRHQPKCPNNR